MKKYYFLAVLLSLVIVSKAQTNTFPTSGNVGIGTASPVSSLSVIGDIHSTGISGGNGMYNHVLKIPPLDSAPAYFYINTNIPATDGAAPQIMLTGYMYAAGTSKALKLTLGWYHYSGNFLWSQWQSDLGYWKPSRIRLGIYNKSGSNYIRIEIANDGIYWANYSVSATDINSSSLPYYTGWSYALGEMPIGTTSQIHTVENSQNVAIGGNVSIGTSNAQGYKLAVAGSMIAESVKVKLQGAWPDYVFTKEYQLPSLQSTEQHIKDKGHLPGIPSATEVEANGVNLGEMNAKLLQKIEELTLYLIDMKKKGDEQNRKMQAEIDLLKSKNK